MAALRAFSERHEIDIVLVHCFDTDKPGHFAHTRVFAPRFGYLEDPATGSGNSAFGSYLLKNNLWDGSAIGIEQGGSDRVFNTVKLTTDKGKILFGGGAITRIEGYYYL
jgi:Predicted epimerase, PhzC/PhzF homolog